MHLKDKRIRNWRTSDYTTHSWYEMYEPVNTKTSRSAAILLFLKILWLMAMINTIVF